MPLSFVSIPRVSLPAVTSVVMVPPSKSPLGFLPAWCFQQTRSWESEIIMNWMWKQGQRHELGFPAGLWHRYSRTSEVALLPSKRQGLQCSPKPSPLPYWLGDLEHSSLHLSGPWWSICKMRGIMALTPWWVSQHVECSCGLLLLGHWGLSLGMESRMGTGRRGESGRCRDKKQV